MVGSNPMRCVTLTWVVEFIKYVYLVGRGDIIYRDVIVLCDNQENVGYYFVFIPLIL